MYDDVFYDDYPDEFDGFSYVKIGSQNRKRQTTINEDKIIGIGCAALREYIIKNNKFRKAKKRKHRKKNC